MEHLSITVFLNHENHMMGKQFGARVWDNLKKIFSNPSFVPRPITAANHVFLYHIPANETRNTQDSARFQQKDELEKRITSAIQEAKEQSEIKQSLLYTLIWTRHDYV